MMIINGTKHPLVWTNVKPESRPERLAAMHALATNLEEQAAMLMEVRELAGDLFEPEHIDLFLHSRNEMLGYRSPIALIRAGEGEQVLRMLRQLLDAAYL